MTPDPLSVGDGPLVKVVDELVASHDGLTRRQVDCSCQLALPSRDALVEIIRDLRSVLFPGYYGNPDLSDASLRYHLGSTLDRAQRQLQGQVKRGMCFACKRDPRSCPQCEQDASAVVRVFLEALPKVRHLLAGDVQAAYEGDPAASSPDEAIFSYPGIEAITNYRIANELHKLEVPLIPRIITEMAHSTTGIDIHPGASIDGRFFIDHGTGVVVGETCVIGSGVRIYQGVTLGAKSFPLDEQGNPIKGIPRHPLVEDDVIIYSGATILGRVTIGRGAVIGGNVWLTRDVPAGNRITQASAQEECFEQGAGI